ncbi:nitroreductase family protein [Propionispora hippei]|uniref:Nitroreductase n=1 Tax=Propionispora hippei DSM 15287 TaxID=1123003 RepID=A0A1M6AP61_9FIRM|nr:nitroreductase [Propionispora hippei]SHI38266.1 Nitroreductase [Propionispora hippei DSM 15287]
MDFKETLYSRRSVRKYTGHLVDKKIIEELCTAATQAPSATNAQPWCFGVIQDQNLLSAYSQQVKAHLIGKMEELPSLQKYHALLSRDDYDIFYGAGTLLLVYAKPASPFAVTDCCLAAQNVMLAAHSLGLGTCWIGFAQEFLQQPPIKQELGIPETYVMVAPLIVGYPASEQEPVVKHAPEIVFWK